LRQAMMGGSALPLMRSLWRERDAAPPGNGSQMFNALRLQARVLNKLRRARNEPEPAAPRFKL